MKSLVAPVKFQLAITSFTQSTQSVSIADSGVSDGVLGEQGVQRDLTMAAAAASMSEGSGNETGHTAGLRTEGSDGEGQLVDSWAQIAGKTHESLLTGTASEHVTKIRPVFLAYNRVAIEGHCILISEVVSALAHVVGDANQIDGVQVMRLGWNIYMKTE